MDETKPPAHTVGAEPADADPDVPTAQPSACPPGAPLQRADAEPDEGDDDWVSL
jgi:hypothetical protein